MTDKDNPIAKWRYTTTEDLREAAGERGEAVFVERSMEDLTQELLQVNLDNRALVAEVERLREEAKVDFAAHVAIVEALKAKLAWFEAREDVVVQRLLDDACRDDIQFEREWLEDNPKP